MVAYLCIAQLSLFLICSRFNFLSSRELIGPLTFRKCSSTSRAKLSTTFAMPLDPARSANAALYHVRFKDFTTNYTRPIKNAAISLNEDIGQLLEVLMDIGPTVNVHMI